MTELQSGDVIDIEMGSDSDSIHLVVWPTGASEPAPTIILTRAEASALGDQLLALGHET